MKPRNKKKAFTIVELVVVIAVIAVLAAVLIPTFSNIVKKAQKSSDTQLVRNLNTALVVDGEEHPTMQSALDAAAKAGYDVAKINATKTDNEILWDSANDVFCYLEKGETRPTYIPETTLKVAEPALVAYWQIARAESDLEGCAYSSYLAYEASGAITTTKGIDAGNNTCITSIKYDGSATGQNVIIRTNGGTLAVEAANDDVKHYGLVNGLTVTAVRADHCYHEFGFVGNLESFGTGKFIVESSAKFHQTMDQVAGIFTVAETYIAGRETQYTQHYYVGGQCVVCSEDECAHTWIAGAVITAANCGTDGSQEYTCSKCGKTKTKVIPATGAHTWGAWTTNETTHARTCPVCSSTDSGEHDSNGEGGKCSVCGYSANPCAEGHSVSEWTTIQEPTCTEAGYQVGTCTVCGELRVEEIPAGHNLVYYKTANPYADKHLAICSVCNTMTTDQNGVRCDTDGEDGNCSKCHSITHDCATDGHIWYDNTTDYVCAICGAWHGTTHNTDGEGGCCSVCGYKAHEHTAAEWTVETAATCTTAGQEKGNCTQCGITIRRSIPATGHTISVYTGFDVFNHKGTCTVCGAEATQSHQYTLVSSEVNVSHYKCDCGVLMDVEGTIPEGHEHTSITINYSEWGKTTTVIEEKTYTVWICTCGNCGTKITYYVPVQ